MGMLSTQGLCALCITRELSCCLSVRLLLLSSGDVTMMHKAMMYIRNNEQSSHIIMVHVSESPSPDVDPVMDTMKTSVATINTIYPKFVVDLLWVRPADDDPPCLP